MCGASRVFSWGGWVRAAHELGSQRDPTGFYEEAAEKGGEGVLDRIGSFLKKSGSRFLRGVGAVASITNPLAWASTYVDVLCSLDNWLGKKTNPSLYK